jgi:hypothetical protein
MVPEAELEMLARVERMPAQEQRLLEQGPQPERELVAPELEERSRRWPQVTRGADDPRCYAHPKLGTGSYATWHDTDSKTHLDSGTCSLVSYSDPRMLVRNTYVMW